jgi:hypothetical protein
MNHTRNLLLIAVCFAFVFVGAAQAQTFYVGGGPSIQSDLPHGAMNATVGIATGDKTMLLLNYSAHGTFTDLKQGALTYQSTAGVRQVMASATIGLSTVEFFLLGDVGAAISASATGFVGAGGGGLTFHPGSHPALSFSGALQGEYSPVNPGGRKNLFIQIGYTFKSSK